MNAKLITEKLPDYRGHANLYLIDDKDYVIVSRANAFDRGDETKIFKADEKGEVINWSDLYAGYGEDHIEALKGYGVLTIQ